jgi:hypothetical protein
MRIPTRKSAVFLFLFHSGQMKALQVKNSSGLDGPAAAMLTKFRQKEKLKI